MDSYVADDNSKENLFQLIALTKSIQQPIEDIRNNCNIRYMKEEPETDYRPKTVKEGDYIVYYKDRYQRTKYTDYNNNETSSDWIYIDTIEERREKIPERVVPVKEKDNSAKEYSDIIKQVKEEQSKDETKGKNRSGYGNSSEGFCKKSNIVKCTEFHCKMDGKKFRSVEKEFNEHFSGEIVGYEIIDNWGDGTNGSWEINYILLEHELKAKFTSKIFRGQNYDLKIYTIDEPKDDSNADDEPNF